MHARQSGARWAQGVLAAAVGIGCAGSHAAGGGTDAAASSTTEAGTDERVAPTGIDGGNDGDDGRAPESAPDGSDSGGSAPGDDPGAVPVEGGPSAEAGGPNGPWVMGYYSSWNASAYPVDQIDWTALTHVATAFNWPDGNGAWNGPGSFDTALAQSG